MVSVLLGNGDGTFQPAVTYARRCGSSRHRGGRLHRRRPDRPGRRGTTQPRHLWLCGRNLRAPGQRRRHVSSPRSPTRWPGRFHLLSWRATSTAMAASTWPSRQLLATTIGVLGPAGQRRRHIPARRPRTRCGVVWYRHRGRGLHWRRPHRPGRGNTTTTPSLTPCGESRCCWATATALSSPSQVRGGGSPVGIVAGDFNGDGHPTSPWPVGFDTCRCCWATATAPSSPRSLTRWDRAQEASWRGTSTATASSTSPLSTGAPTTCRSCWVTATAPSSPRLPTRRAGTRVRSWPATSTATAGST